MQRSLNGVRGMPRPNIPSNIWVSFASYNDTPVNARTDYGLSVQRWLTAAPPPRAILINNFRRRIP